MLPLGEQQAVWWATHILGHMKMYRQRLSFSRGVNQSAYMATPTKDKGALPSLI
jgi:hypothetical protein